METLLTAPQVKTIKTVMDRCNRCRTYLDLLDAMGRPNEDLRTRVQQLEASAKAALEYDRAWKEAGGVWGQPVGTGAAV